jgi:hypothetical protein
MPCTRHHGVSLLSSHELGAKTSPCLITGGIPSACYRSPFGHFRITQAMCLSRLIPFCGLPPERGYCMCMHAHDT